MTAMRRLSWPMMLPWNSPGEVTFDCVFCDTTDVILGRTHAAYIVKHPSPPPPDTDRHIQSHEGRLVCVCVVTSKFMMGSSTAGCAARMPSRTAAAAAMRKAMSEESTAWAVPSVMTWDWVTGSVFISKYTCRP